MPELLPTLITIDDLSALTIGVLLVLAAMLARRPAASPSRRRSFIGAPCRRPDHA